MAIQQYKLDNRRYPVALLARYEASGPMPATMMEARGCLFPEYVKTIAMFHCPSSKVTNSRDPIVHYKVQGMKSLDTLCVYAYDSYDAVVIGGGESGGDYTFYDEGSNSAAPHHRIRWATTLGDVPAPDGVALSPYPTNEPDSDKIRQQDYERQLRWRNPPGDTLVTWCSYHEGPDLGGRCPVVFLDGHADAMPAKEVEGCKWRIRPKKS